MRYELSAETEREILNVYRKQLISLEKKMKAQQSKAFREYTQKFDEQMTDQTKHVADELESLSKSVKESQKTIDKVKGIFNKYLTMALSGVFMVLFFTTFGRSVFDIVGMEYLQQATANQISNATTWYGGLFWGVLFILPILLFLGVFVWLFTWLHDKLID